MNLLALALLQSFSFGAPVAPPAAPAIAVGLRHAAVEAVVVVPTLDAQAQLVTTIATASAADEYPGAWPRAFGGRATGKYYGARYYSSGQGRFTTADLPFADQHIDQPQTWNLYSYTRNNPLKYVDVMGRQTELAVRVTAFIEKYEVPLQKAVGSLMAAKDANDVFKAIRDVVQGTSSVTDQINDQLRSGEHDKVIAGMAGAMVEAHFGKDLLGIDVVKTTPKGRRLGDVDIELNFANVEVKAGERPVDMAQLGTHQSAEFNPDGRPVVVYGPKATKEQAKKIQSTGAMLVRSTTELIDLLRQLKSQSERER